MTIEQITKPPRAKPSEPAAETSLWRAFVAAQTEFGALVKTKPGVRSKYAPLDALLDMARPVLGAHGLAIMQPTRIIDGAMTVATIVIHGATGQSTAGTAFEAEYPVGPATGVLKHQELGAALTYSRRYSLLSALGIHPEDEDDDGEKAGAAGGERAPSQPPPRQQQTVTNPETGRQIDPNNARNSRDKWARFQDKVRAFTDLDALEQWWADGSTQAAIEQMPWSTEAAEEYEKAQERLLDAGRP